MSSEKMGPIILVALTTHHTVCHVRAPRVLVWDYLLTSIYDYICYFDYLHGYLSKTMVHL